VTLTYRNLVIGLSAGSQGDGMCTSKLGWVISSAQQLLVSARSYHAAYEADRSASARGLHGLLKHPLVGPARLKPFVSDWFSHTGGARVSPASGMVTLFWRTYDFCGPGAPYPCDAVAGGSWDGLRSTVRIFRIDGATAHGTVIMTTASHTMPLGTRADLTLVSRGMMLFRMRDSPYDR
jgi:hypothetical protein